MTTIGTVLTVILAVVALVLCIIILMQSKRSAGLGAISGSSNGDTYWSKNKGHSVEGALEKYTKIGGALFMIIAFIINLVS
ncbi:preprotein translocase subunit SecG [Anaerotignum sp.]|uniref:preprotein translocase subunit SecG n=1 Tax=Anaerotignum sp. TaxID=2039241 RepID=UPI00271525CF|nr:preprotein translocase subunit SecG [Anaerotignum sp.]